MTRRVVTDNGLAVCRKSHVKLEPVAALGEREIERGQRVFGNRLLCAHTAVTEKQGMVRHRLRFYRAAFNPGNLVQIEIADRFASVRRFLGLLYRLLKLLVQ